MSIDIEKYLKEKQQLVDRFLDVNLPPEGT